ncbi:MAG: acyl-CoA reductase, partial [Bacteroidetes bacterium]
MNITKRISDFTDLGRGLQDFITLEDCTFIIQIIDKYKIEEIEKALDSTYQYNPWFTPENIRKALSGLAFMLSKEKLLSWIKRYPDINFDPNNPKKIGIVMAGNIPLVGFHDLLTVLISGNHAIIKLSSSDNRLWPHLFDILYSINPEYRNRITVVDDKLKGFDAVIATGSNNTARYFDYYFGKYPHIIRKNRNGVAVINGEESPEELK